MYFQEPSMFHETYPLDPFLEDVKKMEKEQKLLFSYLPKEYSRMQEKVEKVCDRMEYQGSRMYEECPDGNVIHQISKKILEDLRAEKDPFWNQEREGYQEDLICCFLCNEMFRRRYRDWIIKRYIK